MNNKDYGFQGRRDHFVNDTEQMMAVRAPREHALMAEFSQQSQAFAGLKSKVIDMHFLTKDGEPIDPAQLSPEFCARALALLVERVIRTMAKDVHKAA